MCGEVDDDLQADQEMFALAVMLAKQFVIKPGSTKKRDVAALSKENKPSAYMDALFADTLQETINDAAKMPEGMRGNAIANQAIVIARLAGFLAGQFPPESDLYRCAMEAFIDGHGEPNRLFNKIKKEQQDHDHDHGHHHHHHG